MMYYPNNMEKKYLKISIIVRSYNSARLIKRALDSALNQTLDKKYYEILVIDDASQDQTLDILNNDYLGKIRLIKQKHLGARAAIKAGIQESWGKYIVFLDSEDELLPKALEKMTDVFNDASVDFAYFDYLERIGGETKEVSLSENIFNSLWCTMAFKKDLFREIGMPDDTLFFGEYDFLIRLINNGKIGGHIPESLYIYYRNEGSMTANKKRVEEGIKQLREKYGNIAEKIRKY